MSAFTDKEIAYLEEQRLGRLAMVDSDGYGPNGRTVG